MRYYIYDFDFIRLHFGNDIFKILKLWIDVNYKLIRAKSKLKFLKHCKFNTIIPPHLKTLSKVSIHIYYQKSVQKIESLLYRFRKSLLNIEIFDLHRLIPKLQKELIQNSLRLSASLPEVILNSILNSSFNIFTRYKKKTEYYHGKKFSWLMNQKWKFALNCY